MKIARVSSSCGQHLVEQEYMKGAISARVSRSTRALRRGTFPHIWHQFLPSFGAPTCKLSFSDTKMPLYVRGPNIRT